MSPSRSISFPSVARELEAGTRGEPAESEFVQEHAIGVWSGCRGGRGAEEGLCPAFSPTPPPHREKGAEGSSRVT